MGRSIYTDHLKTHPPGFFLEVNSSLLEGLWAALALEKHPEIADEPHELERTFNLCKHVTWSDFWRAFPYKLREAGSYLDELDALGLLLSSSVSKQRFQRYFEQYACSSSSNGSSPSSAQRSSSPTMQDAAQQQQRQASTGFRLGLRLDQMSDGEIRRAVMPGRYRGQYQQLFQPQQQQRQRQEARQPRAGRFPTAANPVAYVPPPARPLLPPAAAAAAGRGRPATAAGSSRAAAAAARTAAAGAAAGAAARLTGRRRTWTEVCEDAAPAPAAAAVAAEQEHPTAITTPSPTAGAPAGPSAAAAVGLAHLPNAEVDNSNMWRAVHDWLTADDEALLVIVSRLVPYNFEGLLRHAGAVREQLQQLANSRPLPDKVVQAISDRMSATSDNNLVRLTASSGYSRRAAAAAAALACSDREPYYISLAGLYKEEDIEAAILQGLFGEALSRSVTPENPGGAAAAAAANLAAAAVAQQQGDPGGGVITAAGAAAAARLNAVADAITRAAVDGIEAAIGQYVERTRAAEPGAAGNVPAAAAIAPARMDAVEAAVDRYVETTQATDPGAAENPPTAAAAAAGVRSPAREVQAAAAAAAGVGPLPYDAILVDEGADLAAADLAATAAAAGVGSTAAEAVAAAHAAIQHGIAQYDAWVTDFRRARAAALAAAAAPAAPTAAEARVAQLERDLGVEFEPGFSVQQRVRILEALRDRRQRRAAAAAAAETAAAAGAADARDGEFDPLVRTRILEAVRAHRDRRAVAAGAAATGDPGGAAPQARIPGGIVAQMPLAQQQQHQHVSDSDSDVDEGLDRMYGIWAAHEGLNLGPARTADLELATTRPRSARDLQMAPAANYADFLFPGGVEPTLDHTDDEEPPGLGGFSEESDEGSDDDADQGIWRIERQDTGFGDFGLQLDPRLLGRQRGIRNTEPVRRDAGESVGYRCGEQFSAYLTLLGTCYKQPLVLLIDEADAALVAGEGQGFRQLLTRVLCMLPQAVLLLCSSYKSEVFGDGNTVLRRQGDDVQYDLGDGTLNIVCHKVPKTLYYRCFF